VKIFDVVPNLSPAHNFSITLIRITGSQLHAALSMARILIGLPFTKWAGRFRISAKRGRI
jgi:hypothetical protein